MVMSEVGGAISEVGGATSEVGGVTSEVGGVTSEVGGATSEVAGRTYVAVGNVQQVFDPTAFGVAQLIAQRLLNDDVVSLVGGQDLVDVLCRSQSVHLMSLLGNRS